MYVLFALTLFLVFSSNNTASAWQVNDLPETCSEYPKLSKPLEMYLDPTYRDSVNSEIGDGGWVAYKNLDGNLRVMGVRSPTGYDSNNVRVATVIAGGSFPSGQDNAILIHTPFELTFAPDGDDYFLNHSMTNRSFVYISGLDSTEPLNTTKRRQGVDCIYFLNTSYTNNANVNNFWTSDYPSYSQSMFYTPDEVLPVDDVFPNDTHKFTAAVISLSVAVIIAYKIGWRFND